MKQERDALQLTIDSGVVVYGTTIDAKLWRTYMISDCATHTARLILQQPITEDTE